MALQVKFIDGADHYIRQDKKWKNGVNGGSTASGVTGGHGGRVNDDADWFFRRTTFSAASRGSFRQLFIFRANSASNNAFIGAQGDHTDTHISVHRNLDETLSVIGPTFTHTTVDTYAIDTPYQIEFRTFIGNGVGEYLLKVDGVVPARAGGGIMWGTNLDTQNSNPFLISFFAGSGTVDTYADDAVIATGNANLGLGEVETLYPARAGSFTQLTRDGLTDTFANFSQCNEAVYDSATTFVRSTADGQRDSYQFDAPAIEGENYFLQVCATCEHGGAGDPTFHFRLFLYIDGEIFDGNEVFNANLTWECYAEVWNVNPSTGDPWQPSDFPIEAGIYCIENGVHMTQIVVEVAALTPTPDPVLAGSRFDCSVVDTETN